MSTISGLLLGEQLAIVAVGRRLLLRRLPLRDELGRLASMLAIDVAQADDFDRRDLHQVKQVGLAVPAAADERHAERFSLRRRRQTPLVVRLPRKLHSNT